MLKNRTVYNIVQACFYQPTFAVSLPVSVCFGVTKRNAKVLHDSEYHVYDILYKITI